MKKMLILTILLGSLVSLVAILLLYPYSFYLSAINEGVFNDRLKLGKVENVYFPGKFYPNRRFKGDYEGNPHLWKNYHFSNFILPFPVSQPQYLVIPILEKMSKSNNRLGYRITDINLKSMFEVELHHSGEFEIDSDQWLFNLPYFKNFIYSKSQVEIWNDLFNKDIKQIEKGGLFSLSQLISLQQRSLQSLVYDLYILFLRKKVFPSNLKNFGFLPNKNVGVLELTEKEMYQEQIMVLNEGKIFTLEVRTRPLLDEPDFMRGLLFSSVEFKETDEDEQIKIYAEHQSLSFEERFKQSGMIILFNALSHNLKNEKMLKEIVRYLERGRAETQQIKPFYDFAYVNYGTNFSEMDFYRKEDTEQYLRRKSVQEQETEKKEAEHKVVDEFQSEEEKVKSYLNEAKNKKNRDKNESKLEGL